MKRAAKKSPAKCSACLDDGSPCGTCGTGSCPLRPNAATTKIGTSELAGVEEPTLTLHFNRGMPGRALRAAALRAAADAEEAILETIDEGGNCAEVQIAIDEWRGIATLWIEIGEGANVPKLVAALARAGDLATGRKTWGHDVHGRRQLVSIPASQRAR